MIKNNFKFLFLTIIIVICFANNLPAMQDPTELKAEALMPKEEDAFIMEFVHAMKNPKVQYDGKKLILNSNPSSFSIFIEALITAWISGSFLICIPKLECKKDFLYLIIFYIIFAGIPIAFLIDDLDAKNNHNHPLITLDENGIKMEDKKLKWKDVELLKKEVNITFRHSEKVFEKQCYKFFDKFMTLLLSLNSNIKNLPINFNNLQVVLEHYIKTYGEKIKMENKENIFNEVNVTTKYIYSPILQV